MTFKYGLHVHVLRGYQISTKIRSRFLFFIGRYGHPKIRPSIIKSNIVKKEGHEWDWIRCPDVPIFFSLAGSSKIEIRTSWWNKGQGNRNSLWNKVRLWHKVRCVTKTFQNFWFPNSLVQSFNDSRENVVTGASRYTRNTSILNDFGAPP